jgi:epoxide hydrolase
VLPSIPGYGFPGPTHKLGWNVARIAQAWDELMTRLGYERYGAEGGDWGASVSRELGIIALGHVIGVHLNMRPPRSPSGRTQLDLEEPVVGADDLVPALR